MRLFGRAVLTIALLLSTASAAADLSVEVGGVKLIELVALAPKPGPVQQPVTWGEAALRR